jgi:hypothetical protein
MRTLNFETEKVLPKTNFTSHYYNNPIQKPIEGRRAEFKRRYTVFDTHRQPNFSHQMQTLKIPLNGGKNLKKFGELMKKSTSKEVQQMMESLVQNLPKNNEMQQLLGKIIKKNSLTPKKVKMVNKKTQTKTPKIKKIKSNKSSTKPLKKKKSGNINKKGSKSNLKKKGKHKKVSSISSLHTGPLKTTSLGGQSLIFRTVTDQTEDNICLTKSVNNFGNFLNKNKSNIFFKSFFYF